MPLNRDLKRCNLRKALTLDRGDAPAINAGVRGCKQKIPRRCDTQLSQILLRFGANASEDI